MTLGREKFLGKVWKWKEYSGGTITKQMRRLGTSPDWSTRALHHGRRPQQSGDRNLCAPLYNEGLIYRGKRLVNWDVKLGTAVSDLRSGTRGRRWLNVAHQLSVSGWIRPLNRRYHTRPETMLGDVAVMVHPEDERYAHLIGKNVKLPRCVTAKSRLLPMIMWIKNLVRVW